jgi:tetratricopeptide (TPR) repeat protein
VHHAHQRGVIHRDLKPANIIVETSDTGILTPKILDFGIARLTGSDAPAAATLVTEAGQIMGTLGFMSPEQVRNEPHEIDVRTDIYALGATLYLLLAGRMPLDLGSKSAFDAAKAVIEEDPPRLGQLAPACRGDVETIVAKAIHKDKEQRYASAAEFAADIRRYLSDEPIAARPPSASYVLRKFASRNKLIVASAAAILLMLAGSSVALSVMYSKAERDRQAAVNARAKAQEETRNLNETVSFLIDDTFGEANPSRKGPSLKVVDVLQDAAAKLDHRFETNPRLRGHVRAIMGTLFNATAQFDLEQAQLTKAIEELDSAGASSESITIGAILQLANTTNLDGQLDKSERLCRDAIARCDPASEDAAEILTAARSVLGESLQKQGRHEEAQRELRGALLTARPTTPKQWDNTIAIRLSLVASLSAQGRVQEIDPLLQETLAVCRAHMPEDAPSTIATLHWISNRLLQQDKFAEADPMALDIVARIERCYSSDHPNVAFACMSAATIKSKIGDLASAVSLSTRSFDILRKHFDEGDFNIEKSAGTVAALIEDSGDVARSLPYYAIFLRARLLAARADERAGVVDRTMQYLMRAAHVRQKGSPPTIEDLLAWVEECRLHTPLIVKEGGLTRSPHAARLLANLAVSAAAFKPQDEHAMSIARSLAAEARAALQASERIEEDTALVSSVEQELAKNQTGRQ